MTKLPPIQSEIGATAPTVETDGNTNPSVKPKINSAKNWCFTYNNYKDAPTFIQLLRTVCKRYICQEETGENGTPHLQGYLEFEFKCRPKEKIKIPQIHWEITRDVVASINYCSKEETRTGKIYNYRIPIPKPINLITNLKSWQTDIVNIIEEEPNDRSIYWFWEAKGGIGKTVFCKYMVYYYQALVLSGKASDMKYGIIKYIEKNGGYPPIIIFDIPRSCLDYLSYQGIEEVKNGLFFSSKYESDMVIGNCPHIICFANEEPRTEKLSQDRWIIRNIRH